MSEQTATATEEGITQPQPAQNGTFCWNELASKDVETAKKFYAELLGWTLKDSNGESGMTYTEIRAGEKSIGGMYQPGPECGDGAEMPSHWMSYVAVDDVDKLAERVTELGGSVCVPPTDIPNVGRFSVINDPTGAVISLITLRDGSL